MILRDYQKNSSEAILRDFETVSSTLAVMPTGTGKTAVASEIIRQFLLKDSEAGCIFLAHREELLHQAKRAIEAHCKTQCEFELGNSHASEIFPADVLLASVQTMISGRNGSRRMHKFSPYNYGLIVIDEVHHSTAASYRTVLDYFRSGNPEIKVLGITATPERADEEALGQIFESVAFDYPILQAIQDGWLVPVQQQLIDIQSLDFSHVRTTAGDLNAGDLAKVMEAERNLYGICDAVMREYKEGDKGIMFTVSIAQAVAAAEILNRYRSNFAVAVSGKTPAEDRRRIMRDYAEGRYCELVNCNLVSEGVDVPAANKLHQARPTKSKLLYQQQLGRIMRPLSGVVDGLSDALARRTAIAGSLKATACVIDFVGNAGRHKLVHAVDVLGGKISDKARELAERELRKTGRPERIDELVIEAERQEREEAQRKEAARRARLTARAKYTRRYIDPFDAFDVCAPSQRTWDRSKHLSDKQCKLLIRQGINPDQMTYSEGKVILNEMFRRFSNNLCSLKQAAILKRRGFDTKEITRDQARLLIDKIAKQEGWKKKT